MPITKLVRDNNRESKHSGTGAITLTHIVWPGETDGNINIEWELSSKKELITMATEFLLWLDQVAPHGGVVENAIKNWAEENGKIEDGQVRLRYKQAEHPGAEVDLGK